MSTYTATQWTCDRCGRQEEVGAHGSPPDQPVGWGALYLVKPPLMNPNESDQRPDQVCRECVGAFRAWFVNGRISAGVPA